MRFYGFKQYLNEIFLLKWYSNEMTLLMFVCSPFGSLILFIFWNGLEKTLPKWYKT